MDWAGWDVVFTDMMLAVGMSIDNATGAETLDILSHWNLEQFSNDTTWLKPGTPLHFVVDTTPAVEGVTKTLGLYTLEITSSGTATLTDEKGDTRETAWEKVTAQPDFASKSYDALYFRELDVTLFYVYGMNYLKVGYWQNGNQGIMGNGGQYIILSGERGLAKNLYDRSKQLIGTLQD